MDGITPLCTSDITLEKVSKLMREIEVEQDARDLDLFLSDDWPFYKIIREGGTVMQIGDQYYAVSQKWNCWQDAPLPRSFPIRPKS